MPEKVDLLADPAAASSGALDKIAAARVWLLKENRSGVLSRALIVEPGADVRSFVSCRRPACGQPARRAPDAFPALCARLAHTLFTPRSGIRPPRRTRPRRWNLAHDLAIDPLVTGAVYRSACHPHRTRSRPDRARKISS
jgi:hypothetical protein